MSEAFDIIVADAEPRTRAVLEAALAQRGYRVLGMDLATRVLPAIRASSPAVIVADTSLGLSAIVALALELNARSTGRPAILAIAETSERDERLALVDAGVDEVVERPIYLREVVARVEVLLARRQSTSLLRGETSGAGPLGTLGVLDLVHHLAGARFTGRLHLQRRSMRGHLCFVDGALVHAVMEREVGMPVLVRVLGWSEGSFRIEAGPAHAGAPTLSGETAALLREGVAAQLRVAAARDRRLSPDQVFVVDYRSWTELEETYPPDAVALIRIFDGLRPLEDVIALASLPDEEGWGLVHRLLDDGIIHDAKTSSRAARRGLRTMSSETVEEDSASPPPEEQERTGPWRIVPAPMERGGASGPDEEDEWRTPALVEFVDRPVESRRSTGPWQRSRQNSDQPRPSLQELARAREVSLAVEEGDAEWSLGPAVKERDPEASKGEERASPSGGASPIDESLRTTASAPIDESLRTTASAPIDESLRTTASVAVTRSELERAATGGDEEAGEEARGADDASARGEESVAVPLRRHESARAAAPEALVAGPVRGDACVETGSPVGEPPGAAPRSETGLAVKPDDSGAPAAGLQEGEPSHRSGTGSHPQVEIREAHGLSFFPLAIVVVLLAASVLYLMTVEGDEASLGEQDPSPEASLDSDAEMARIATAALQAELGDAHRMAAAVSVATRTRMDALGEARDEAAQGEERPPEVEVEDAGEEAAADPVPAPVAPNTPALAALAQGGVQAGELPAPASSPAPAEASLAEASAARACRDGSLPVSGRLEACAQEIRRAPRSVEAHLVMGGLLYEQGELARARPLLEEAVRLSPRSAHAWLQLGAVRQEEGAIELAREAYGRYLELVPEGRRSDEIRSVLEGLR